MVIGTYFSEEVQPLRAEHLGLFWASIRSQFPVATQQAPLARPGAIASPFSVEVSEFLPMPRYWFEGGNPAFLMQIQKDAFLFNWRKKEAEYPHFEAVKAAFDKGFLEYAQFLRQEFNVTPRVTVAELTYINVIHQCEYWNGPADTSSVFPNFRSVDGAASDFQQIAVRRFEKDLALRTTVRNGLSGEGVPTLIFELRCSGHIGEGEKSALDIWFGRAHNLINQTFLNVTAPAIQQKYWDPIEAANVD